MPTDNPFYCTLFCDFESKNYFLPLNLVPDFQIYFRLAWDCKDSIAKIFPINTFPFHVMMSVMPSGAVCCTQRIRERCRTQGPALQLVSTENMLPPEPLCHLSPPGNTTISSLPFFSKTMPMYLWGPQLFLVHHTGHWVVFNDSIYTASNLHGSQPVLIALFYIFKWIKNQVLFWELT